MRNIFDFFHKQTNRMLRTDLNQKNLFDIMKKYGANKEERMCVKYETLFQSIRNEVRFVLEIGIQTGASLLAWREYFPNAVILGVDIDPSPLGLEDRIRTAQFSQDDIASFVQFFEEQGVSTLDVIIDDAAHIGYLAKASFWPLYDNWLKDGGLYIIEDWGTGYWGDFPDGMEFHEPLDIGEQGGRFESHHAGMVGFLKQLVDESFRSCVRTDPIKRNSKFEYLCFQENIVTVKKPTAYFREIETRVNTGVSFK